MESADCKNVDSKTADIVGDSTVASFDSCTVGNTVGSTVGNTIAAGDCYDGRLVYTLGTPLHPFFDFDA